MNDNRKLFDDDVLYRRPAIAVKLGGLTQRCLDGVLASLERVRLSPKLIGYYGRDLNALVSRGLQSPGVRALPTGIALQNSTKAS